MIRMCLGFPIWCAGLAFLCCGGVGIAQTLQPQDLVVAAEIPIYPPTAVAARIDGTVVAAIKVSKGVVVEADIVSGPLVLASSVKRNLLTWRFDANVYGTQRVVYVFELSKTVVLRPENPEIELRLPSSVKLVAKPVQPVTIGSSSVPLGNPIRANSACEILWLSARRAELSGHSY